MPVPAFAAFRPLRRGLAGARLEMCASGGKLLAGWDPDDVSRSNLHDGPTPYLNPAGARRDDQDLTSGMRVPRRAGTGLERTDPPLACDGSRAPLKSR